MARQTIPGPWAWTLLAGCFLAGCQPAGEPGITTNVSGVFTGEAGRWVDLTHPFATNAVYWPTADGFTLDTVSWGMTEGGYFYSAFNFSAAEHGGTHLDAPIHFAENRLTTDQLPLTSLIGPAAVVDPVTPAGADDQLEIADFTSWEEEHGRIPDGAILLLRTGWGSRYANHAAYIGTERRGPDAVPLLHFPGLAPVAAQWLVDERRVAAVGIDTPSIDYGQSTLFESHRILYEQDIPGFENVGSLDQLPAIGSFIVALPMKIEGGSGAPLRIVAFVPDAPEGDQR